MNDLRFVLVAADLEDFIFPAIIILFLVISALGQVLAKIREAQRLEEARRRGPVPHTERPLAPVRPPPQVGRPPQSGWPAPRAPQPRRAEEPIEVKPAELVPEAHRPSLAEPLRKDAPTQELAHLTSHLGIGLSGAGDVMAGHLHEVFDHQLGALGRAPGESAEPEEPPSEEKAEGAEDWTPSIPQTAAAGLAAILADPTSLRQAILLNEIFQRPEHRWS